jgi:hypothetical protein
MMKDLRILGIETDSDLARAKARLLAAESGPHLSPRELAGLTLAKGFPEERLAELGTHGARCLACGERLAEARDCVSRFGKDVSLLWLMLRLQLHAQAGALITAAPSCRLMVGAREIGLVGLMRRAVDAVRPHAALARRGKMSAFRPDDDVHVVLTPPASGTRNFAFLAIEPRREGGDVVQIVRAGESSSEPLVESISSEDASRPVLLGTAELPPGIKEIVIISSSDSRLRALVGELKDVDAPVFHLLPWLAAASEQLADVALECLEYRVTHK